MSQPLSQLRQTLPEDLDFVLTIETAAHAAGYVQQWSRDRHQQALQHPDERHWIVMDAATDRAVGYVILWGAQDPSQCLHIKRIVISEPGQGYGHAALQQVLNIAFMELQAHRVWLDVMEDNERARSLYQRLGLVEEGRLREAAKTPMGFKSLWLMSMLRTEFMARYQPS